MKANLSSITKKYRVICIDPPWFYTSSSNPSGNKTGAGENYDLMTDDELKDMKDDMQRILFPSMSVIFMWATCPRLDFAVELGKYWGFYFRGVPFIWIKTNKDGAIMGAKGIRPTIVKPVAELVLAFSTEKKGRPVELFDEAVRQVVLAPPQKHSEKPEEIYERIDSLYPTVKPKLEMFARKPREGWDVWGNEVS